MISHAGRKMSTSGITKKFVYISLMFGILFMVLTPPFQVPDEDSHFKKAYVLSKGNFFPEVQDEKLGYMLPSDMVAYINMQNAKCGKLDEKFSYKDVYLLERSSAERGEQIFDGFSTAKTNPIGHIIQATGITFGNVMAKVMDVQNPSVLYYLYFARFFNLLFYVTIIAVSISITPILKRMMAMIGIMPMSLFLAASTSYDSILISLAFLACAIIFQISFGKELNTLNISYMVILILIAYVFIVIKIVYIPIFLLLLFLPKFELKNKKCYAKKLLGMGVVVVLLYIITKMIIPRTDVGKITDEAILAAQQIQFILHNPIKYMNIFIHTISELRMFFISTTIGTFGLIDTNLFCVVLIAYVCVMMIVGIAEISLDNIKIKIIDRLATFTSVAATIFGCFLAMYIYWTSILEGYGVGAGEIQGVQGRYFIPVMPLVFLIFANTKLQRIGVMNKGMRIVADNFILPSIMILCAAIVSILVRFWC